MATLDRDHEQRSVMCRNMQLVSYPVFFPHRLSRSMLAVPTTTRVKARAFVCCICTHMQYLCIQAGASTLTGRTPDTVPCVYSTMSDFMLYSKQSKARLLASQTAIKQDQRQDSPFNSLNTSCTKRIWEEKHIECQFPPLQRQSRPFYIPLFVFQTCAPGHIWAVKNLSLKTGFKNSH